MSHTWIFDLDDTLHNASHAIFPRINQLMTEYVVHHLGIDEHAAIALRQHYYKRYGATLSGLKRHHAIDPQHFLRTTHDPLELLPLMKWDRSVDAILGHLPGRKIMLSNGPQDYIEGVSDRMGITRHFSALYGIERVDYLCKPDPHAFRTVLREEHCRAARCIMVEDNLDNLRTAKRLGMRTVWISPAPRKPSYVDFHIARLADLRKLPLPK